jgi:C4-dicarboxylate-specific signal transduction histidine kinase
MAESRRRVEPVSLPPGTDDEAYVHAASMAELGVLTASLLHELRQPLFAIKAHAQLARAEGGQKPDRLDRILDQVTHIEALVRYYGGFGRSGDPEVLFDLNDSVRAAVEMIAHKSKKSGVTIEIELWSGPLLVRGREVAARQIAINLVQNAFDAVEARRGRVVVRTRDMGQTVRLEVEDDGTGVPVAIRDRMFDPFVTTKPAGRGTGLGLYISRKLADEARGSIRYDGPEAGASRFSVDLPRG